MQNLRRLSVWHLDALPRVSLRVRERPWNVERELRWRVNLVDGRRCRCEEAVEVVDARECRVAIDS